MSRTRKAECSTCNGTGIEHWESPHNGSWQESDCKDCLIYRCDMCGKTGETHDFNFTYYKDVCSRCTQKIENFVQKNWDEIKVRIK